MRCFERVAISSVGTWSSSSRRQFCSCCMLLLSLPALRWSSSCPRLSSVSRTSGWGLHSGSLLCSSSSSVRTSSMRGPMFWVLDRCEATPHKTLLFLTETPRLGHSPPEACLLLSVVSRDSEVLSRSGRWFWLPCYQVAPGALSMAAIEQVPPVRASASSPLRIPGPDARNGDEAPTIDDMRILDIARVLPQESLT